jgi:hypothetical protein
MGLVISKGLTLRRELPADAEADAYIAAVEAADGQALEPGVKFAIKNFVLCCKQDGIWDAIKASCILAGARTRLGALTPLVGTAPTSFNFVDGDYNRKTGLVGDGSTKYLDSNRNNNADPQNNKHFAVFATTFHTRDVTRAAIGIDTGTVGASHLLTAESPSRVFFRNNFTDTAVALLSGATTSGFWASSRSSSTGYTGRFGSSSIIYTDTSSTPGSGNMSVFARSTANYSNARLAFYSIGESLDLALLDARVTDLINAFGAAIP